MRDADNTELELTPAILLKAYACGIFPMAESAEDTGFYWVEPELRGIFPLDRFHIPRRLARTVRTTPLGVSVNTDFNAVISGCAASAPGRRKTWINRRIRSLYTDLHLLGYCHTVEVRDGSNLVGGLYGVHLGSAFFGESMFSTVTDASKIALVHLVARLISGGFKLLDTQFVTRHLQRLGAIEVSRLGYHSLLDEALGSEATFFPDAAPTTGEQALTTIAAHAADAGAFR